MVEYINVVGTASWPEPPADEVSARPPGSGHDPLEVRRIEGVSARPISFRTDGPADRRRGLFVAMQAFQVAKHRRRPSRRAGGSVRRWLEQRIARPQTPAGPPTARLPQFVARCDTGTNSARTRHATRALRAASSPRSRGEYAQPCGHCRTRNVAWKASGRHERRRRPLQHTRNTIGPCRRTRTRRRPQRPRSSSIAAKHDNNSHRTIRSLPRLNRT